MYRIQGICFYLCTVTSFVCQIAIPKMKTDISFTDEACKHLLDPTFPFVLPPIQIVGRFGKSSYIVFATYLHIAYI